MQARKPDFFNHNMSLYEVVTDDGLMRPVMKARKGALFCGGSARMVEAALGIEGDEVIHGLLGQMYADQPYTTLQRSVGIHPTVSELVPTMLGELKPAT